MPSKERQRKCRQNKWMKEWLEMLKILGEDDFTENDNECQYQHHGDLYAYYGYQRLSGIFFHMRISFYNLKNH